MTRLRSRLRSPFRPYPRTDRRPRGRGLLLAALVLASLAPAPSAIAATRSTTVTVTLPANPVPAPALGYNLGHFTVGSNAAAGYQLATQESVMPIGGFNGSDPSPTLAQFQSLVKQGKVRYVGDHVALVVADTLAQARELIKCLSHEQSVLLLSPPGVGKSDVVQRAAADAGLECKSLLGTQIAPEDVSGVPRIVGERSVFCPPRVLLPENATEFCLFLDELPACAPDVQKAFYSLLLERRIGEYRLPPGTWVVAAGNRAEDKALVRTISSALVNRVLILNVRVDVGEWLSWARDSGVRG